MTAQNGFRDFHYQSPDGLKLHARIYGEGNADAFPVICLPGLTRNSRDFHELALYLSRDATTPRKIISFDYRGRGQSDYDPDWTHYDVIVEANDILAGLDALGIQKAAFIGTSRGGLILHVLAAVRPQILAGVILNDIGPALDVDGLAMIRAYLNAPFSVPRTYEEAAVIQERIHAHAFPILDKGDWLAMAHALYKQEDGVLLPDFDPALLQSFASFDPSKPLPTLWPQFQSMVNLPVMVIRGENSRLLTPEIVEEMARVHPQLDVVIAKGQGHAPLLHKDGLAKRIEALIDTI